MADLEKALLGLTCCQIPNEYCDMCPYNKISYGLCMKEMMRDALEPLQAMADLVRCKDCRYWDERMGDCHNVDGACFSNGVCRPDFFCSDGERRV